MDRLDDAAQSRPSRRWPRPPLRYANLGIPVFPCVPGGKQPLTPNGFHDATSSARVVHDWWQRTPDANIGLPTGARTGILVVDVDVHAGGSGFAGVRARPRRGPRRRLGLAGPHPVGRDPRLLPAARTRSSAPGRSRRAHVDFRGDGGYVIAPPSRIEVDGAMKTYDVIAVTTQPRSRSTRSSCVSSSSRRDRHRTRTAVPTANGCSPEALAGRSR